MKADARRPLGLKARRILREELVQTALEKVTEGTESGVRECLEALLNLRTKPGTPEERLWGNLNGLAAKALNAIDGGNREETHERLKRIQLMMSH